jgi:hypothetical protein
VGTLNKKNKQISGVLRFCPKEDNESVEKRKNKKEEENESVGMALRTYNWKAGEGSWRVKIRLNLELR